jgi:predicted Zn-dependent protease
MFGIKPTNIKSVLQYDLNMNLIKEWNDITQASKELNIYNSNISMCCKGKLKTTGGYIWKYKNNL